MKLAEAVLAIASMLVLAWSVWYRYQHPVSSVSIAEAALALSYVVLSASNLVSMIADRINRQREKDK